MNEQYITVRITCGDLADIVMSLAIAVILKGEKDKELKKLYVRMSRDFEVYCIEKDPDS